MHNATTNAIAANPVRRSAVNEIMKSSAAVGWLGDSEMT
jgi:hypothetical protein